MIQKFTTFIFALLLLALPAVADGVESADYMTVKVDSVPADVRDVYMALGPDTWVSLDRVSEHQWTGEFLFLSGLYNSVTHPEVHLLGMHGLDSPAGPGVKVQIISSAHPMDQLQGMFNDSIDVVVSNDVIKESLALEDSEGALHQPQFRGSAFRLPAIDRGDIAVIRVQRDDGSNVKYAFGRDVDLAEIEDELDK